MAFLQKPTLEASMSDSTSSSSRPPQPPPSSIFAPRSRKQLSFFFAGAAFFGLSTFITRRSLTRRYVASIPRFYQPSNQPFTQFNGAMEAFEALNIATMNVASVTMMMTGGLLWAFDISTIEEMRGRLRKRLGLEGEVGKDAEEEFEEWLATTLARRDGKRAMRGGGAERDDVDEDEEEKGSRRRGKGR